ncbi:esterase [Paraburkholderia sp. G-4-1-8]|uniref:Esterase n=2 Tax=Paraburkholderia antibiotica TaxID=2728839 RepID=A0A7X9X741_9BURK|nr:esterase [Paraburkholderia antibiotica]
MIGAAALCAQPASAQYLVKEVGSFHIGGRTVTLDGLPARTIVFSPGSPPVKVDPNGEFDAYQMYVQYVKLERPAAKYPLLLWHGGGLTGVTFETKPDGRPGWQQYFLNAGYDTYVSDAVERGRASFAQYPEIYSSAPFFRSKREAWVLFRIGPSYGNDGQRVAYPDSRFPAASFDQFTKQFVPRWSSNDDATQQAYNAEVDKVCPCIVLMHSQGANFGFNAELATPQKIKAIVAIEPSGFPDLHHVDLQKLKGIPHLFIFGDHLVGPFWEKVHANAHRYAQALSEASAPVTFIDLPARGIHGNSHMLMMDDNSDQVAAIVDGWLRANTR